MSEVLNFRQRHEEISVYLTYPLLLSFTLPYFAHGMAFGNNFKYFTSSFVFVFIFIFIYLQQILRGCLIIELKFLFFYFSF